MSSYDGGVIVYYSEHALWTHSWYFRDFKGFFDALNKF